MDMEPAEIRIGLMRAGVSQSEIARRCNVSFSMVCRVIDGDSVSHNVRQEIANASNRDIRTIWPSIYLLHGGPRKPGRPKTTQETAIG